MKMKFLISGFALLAMMIFAPLVSADDPFTWTSTIEPQDFDGFPLIPISDTESMDVTVESDIPITLFIINTQEGYEELIALSEGEIEDFTGYDKKFEDVTYKEISQDYDSEKSYWVMIYNPSETESAEVTVDYEFWEDITEEVVEDALADACCLFTMGAGIIGTIGLIATVLNVRERR